MDLNGAKIDLGCGERKRSPDHIGVDRRDLPGVDLVGEVRDVLAEVPDGVVDEIYCSHFLEHVDDLTGTLREMCRVIRRGGSLEIVVPHFSNPYFASDPTHRHRFGLYTFSYLIADARLLRRRVPRYDAPLPVRLERVHLGFKSTPPFYGRHAIKRAIGALVNSSDWSREFYEENLASIAPCYEIEFVMARL
jgi:ubiquinone/menaquinone biosynthesis C-methylase UbiE